MLLTLKNKNLLDNNLDNTECSTLVGTNKEPNKIIAIKYSRSNYISIKQDTTTKNFTFLVIYTTK